MQLGGNSLAYQVTVGTPGLRSNGQKVREVVFTAYIIGGESCRDLRDERRSRRIFRLFEPQRHRRSASSLAIRATALQITTLMDNPGTWLDFTDLVFIDPIGTGYSRSWCQPRTKTQFYSTEADIHYLSRIIYDWLVKNGRMGAKILRWRKLRRLSGPGSPTTCNRSSAWR